MSAVEIDLPWYARSVFRYGRPVVLVVALIMSIPGEIHLAEVAGWGRFPILGYDLNVAALMPVCVSVYAACAAVIADVSTRHGLPGRKSAQAGAVAALVLALLAQDISHLIQQDYMGSSAALVGAVSAVPPLVVFHMLHMAAAPRKTATTVQVENPAEGDFEDELDDAGSETATKRRSGRPGRPGKAPEAVVAAAEKVAATKKPLNAATLGAELGLSARQGRRYMAMLKEIEAKQQPDTLPFDALAGT
ncbi:hypothetical protein ACWDUX_30310 [Streptomyces sp. NPDC003444]